MWSHQEPSRPIRGVGIKVALEAEKDLLDSISKKIPGSRVSGGHLSLTITASDPQEALEEVRNLAASLRRAHEPSKDFK